MKTFRSYFFFILLFYTCAVAQTKNDMLFEETRITLNNALLQNAHILSQQDFNRSAEHYIKAQEIFKRNGSSPSVTDELEESIALLTVINEKVENSSEFFKTALTARQNALDKNANRYTSYYWNLGENNIYDAIEEYKDHNYEESSKLVMTATGFYSRAGDNADRVNNLLSNWNPIKNADNSLAFLLSPNNYSEGLNNYFDAIEMLSDGKEINSVNEKTSEATKYFDLSTSVAKDFLKGYTLSITSREVARSAGAETYASAEWKNAEEILKRAGREFEKKNYNATKEYAADAAQKYKLSKQIAVKEKFLFIPRQKIQLAKENEANDYAPKTLDNSIKYYLETEKLIETDSYTETEIGSIAKQSEFEADKAIWIAGIIKSVKNGDATWEDVILRWNIYDTAAQQSGTPYVKTQPSNKPSADKFSKYISDRSYVDRFPDIDMEALKEGDKILLRVYNINFRPAGWRLNDEAKSVLNQLVIALENLNGSQYQISSYTDAVGAQRTNTEISESRAQAIVDYLKEHSGYLSNKMISAGYGEVNPIAENKDYEGRKKNNRIEILISD